MRSLTLATMSAMLISAPVAAKPPQPERLRQLSEVVFQNYPARALAAGEQGPVYFIVKLDDTAHPTSCEVTHSSGFPQLDAETCDLIVQHAVFKSLIGANGKAIKSTHEGVVNWRIPGTPQPPINPIPVTAATAPEKQICKKTPRTGTLSGYNRQCMTESEWSNATKETQDYWGQYQGRQGMTKDPGTVSGPVGGAGPGPQEACPTC